jgi:hypothetical protein
MKGRAGINSLKDISNSVDHDFIGMRRKAAAEGRLWERRTICTIVGSLHGGHSSKGPARPTHGLIFHHGVRPRAPPVHRLREHVEWHGGLVLQRLHVSCVTAVMSPLARLHSLAQLSELDIGVCCNAAPLECTPPQLRHDRLELLITGAA